MRTFRGSASITFKIVAQQQYADDLRRIARSEEGDTFLKLMDSKHPMNDDAFIEAVLKNGIAKLMRNAILAGIDHTPDRTLGGTVAPAQVTVTASIPGHEGAEATVVVETPKRAARLALAVSPAMRTVDEEYPSEAKASVLPYDGTEQPTH